MADVLAVFPDPASASAGIRAARVAGATELRARMPAPFPDVLEAIGRGRSELGTVTLLGAVAGIAGGFGLATYASLSWPIITGGKPIVAIPSFVVVSFESAVLVAVVLTFIGLGILVMRTRRIRPVPADPRFSRDFIGVLAVGGDAATVESALRTSGAVEVTRVR